MTPWNPCQVTTKNVNGECRRHEERAHPETPVPMHARPVRTRAWLAALAAVAFVIVPVARQIASIMGEYSPRRAA
jgi:hypothetical protein